MSKKNLLYGLLAATAIGGGTLFLASNPSTPQDDYKAGGACKYSCTSPDRDCSDFSSHTQAQAFFNCCGFTATNDPMKLDSVGVGNGVACESLP